METTFYDDSQFRSTKGDIRIMKRPMTLDLDSPGLTKKQKFTALLTSPDLNMLKLASPELERFIIAQNGLVTTTPTPTQFLFPKNVTEEQEQYARGFVDALEQLHKTSIDFNNGSFILPHNGEIPALNCVTTSSASLLSPATLSRLYSGTLPVQLSPSTIVTTVPTLSHPQVTSTTSTIKTARPASVESTNSNSFSSVNYNSIPSVTSLPQVTSTNTTTVSAVRPASVESTSSNSFPGVNYISIPPNITIKEEPQTVPNGGSTPPLSPIDMEDQERIKLERKRLRNRIAASKCRRRKLERISRLEDKVKLLKGENTELGSLASKLREQVCQLKQQVLDHVKSGCQIMVTNSF